MKNTLLTLLALQLAAGCTLTTTDLADAGTSRASDAGRSSRGERTPDAACPTSRDQAAGKLFPSEAELRQRLDDGSASFIVLMKDDLNLSSLPTTLPDGGPADRNEASQACARQEVAQLGGVFVSSFVLINAFEAELTVDSAVALSTRSDVRVVELSETDTPPP